LARAALTLVHEYLLCSLLPESPVSLLRLDHEARAGMVALQEDMWRHMSRPLARLRQPVWMRSLRLWEQKRDQIILAYGLVMLGQALFSVHRAADGASASEPAAAQPSASLVQPAATPSAATAAPCA
jgi:hypothetical protein